MKPKLTINFLTLITIRLLLSLSIVLSNSIFAETISERKLRIQQEFEKRKNTQQQYLDQKKQKFSDYLAKHWHKFEAFKADKMPLKPKPIKQPVYKKPQEKILPQRIIKPKPKPIIKVPQNNLKVNFYGEIIDFGPKNDYQNLIKNLPSSLPVNKATISKYGDIDEQLLEPIVGRLTLYYKRLKLDDWGRWLLIKKFTKSILANNVSQQALLQWKLLMSIGFDARIAIVNNDYSLLFPIVEQVYRLSFIKINGTRYYLLLPNKRKVGPTSIHTYDKDIFKGKKFSSFQPSKVIWPNNKSYINARELTFANNDMLAVKYDSRQIKLLNDYPSFNFSFYFNSDIHPTTKASLRDYFSNKLKGKTTLEKSQYLLDLIQKYFPYKTDKEQFGKERYLFVDETIHYQFSDCEDRSFLYGWLVKYFADVDYIGIMYPNHLATAIAIRKNGDSVYHQNRKYIVADPTFIGAPIGKAMTKSKPKIVFSSR